MTLGLNDILTRAGVASLTRVGREARRAAKNHAALLLPATNHTRDRRMGWHAMSRTQSRRYSCLMTLQKSETSGTNITDPRVTPLVSASVAVRENRDTGKPGAIAPGRLRSR